MSHRTQNLLAAIAIVAAVIANAVVPAGPAPAGASVVASR